jgi:acyl transferase domain-containing protein/acyl carrier protein
MSDQDRPQNRARDLDQWIVHELATRLRIDPRAIDRRERFNRYGLDSMEAAAFTGALAARLGRALPPTLVWDHPSIEQLVGHLTAPAAAPAPEPHRPPRTPHAVSEPVAIVGIACRFPQAADPAAYWRLLATGTDAISEVPRDRWDAAELFDGDLAAPGKMNTRWGGFLDQVDRFDAQAFRISPREAAQMDPQQRLMLELCSEALDDAGVALEPLRGSDTGVFVGAMWSDYARLIAGDASAISPHTATGQDTSILAGRVSYVYGLQGPSLTVNTACSSSLVAVHLACQSLRMGESTLALAGGVSLIVSPESTVAMSKFGAMAPDGRSKAFDARANGYVRGEGAGVVVLKPLSRALADGDSIYCVIAGSAVNNDGFSNGLTAPNPQAQEHVLRAAYRNAGVPADRVQYIEAHGTGTLLGDPIEAGALGAVLGSGRPVDQPLLLGSVKTNFGHLEAAAGVAGLIKVALSIRHRLIPASLHFQAPNPHIRFDELRLRVQTRLGPWPGDGGVMTAGISSFGFGGTNCHVVVRGSAASPARLLTLTANGADDLASRVAAIARRLENLEPGDDVAVDDQRMDRRGEVRAAVVFGTAQDLRRKLAALESGTAVEGVARGTVSKHPGGIVFVCSGHGSQWAGMARSLLQAEPVFRAKLQECAAAIERVAGWNAIDELTADAAVSRVDQVDIAQPLLFAISVSLAALWESWGVAPDAVVGHSMGEVAAACIAGALSVEDAARVIHHRSRLLARLSGTGSIAVLGLSRAETERRFTTYGDRLTVAACNGPSTTVVAADPQILRAVVSMLADEGIFARLVNAAVPFHSPAVDPLRAELFESIRTIAPHPHRLAIYSTVAAGLVEGAQLGASYWVRNLREPVLFAQAIEAALRDGRGTFVELSPHPVLAAAISQTLEHAGVAGLVVPSGRRDDDERRVMLESAAKLFVRGVADAIGNAAATGPAPAGAGAVALSAHTAAALRDRARSLAAFVREPRGVDTADLSYTTTRRRTHLEHRAVVVAGSRAELAERLDAVARGEQASHSSIGRATGQAPRVAFVFCGQGPQWWGMGRELSRTQPVYRAMLERCDALVRRHADWSLLEELWRDESASRIDRLDIVQPAIFALQVALAELWREWGVVPSAVIGHSMGEVSAACVAGVLTLEDAVRVIVARGRIVQRAAGKGRTAAIDLDAAAVRHLIEPFGGRVGIAAVNGRYATTISGEPSAVAEVLNAAAAKGHVGREVRMDFASHSAQMDALVPAFLTELGTTAAAAATTPFYSTVSGRRADAWELDVSYWGRNLREPVRFADACAQLVREADVAIELGPHPVLSAALADAIDLTGANCVAVPSLRRGQGDAATMLAAAGALHVTGCPVQWDRIAPEGRCVSLPPYPWQRQRFWLDVARRPERTGERSDSAAPAKTAFYDVEWRAATEVSVAPTTRSWLLLGEDEALAAAFAADRHGRGERCVMARGLVDEETLGAGLADAFGAVPADGVIVYITSRGEITALSSASRLESDAIDSCAAIAAIVRSLRTRFGGDHSVAPRLWVVTRGAQHIESGDDVSLTQAPVWGLARVLALEHPEFWGGIVDLPGEGTSHSDARALASLLSRGDGEDQIAFRGVPYVPRLLESGAVGPSHALRLREDATYLVTGGLGRLGSKVARWMVDRGARHLVLVGRRTTNDQAVAEIERAGASVSVVHGDVADEQWVASLVHHLAAGDRPLRGIVHAAGRSTRAALADLDRHALAADFAAKGRGAWALHQASSLLALDFFVMFSSAAAIWGARDMGAYAAVNAFLDALARHRHERGLPALSVNFGPWDEVGVVSEDVRRAWERTGALGMPETEALAALDRLMSDGATNRTVARVEWDRFKTVYEARAVRPFLDAVGQPLTEAGIADAVAIAWLDGLDHATADERRAHLARRLQQELCDILGLDKDAPFDSQRGFAQMGLDSLMAIEFRNRLQRGMGRRLPPPVVFNYPNVRAMAAFLAGEPTPAPAPEAHVPTAVVERPLGATEIADLSEDEAEALLATRLAALGEGGR